ncbi:MAG: hypothetical protein V4662_13650 [Verrucomicrobiota bacterium]
MSTERPFITSRDLSMHEAVAGINARSEAAGLGGDPTQIGALGRAASAQPPQMRECAAVIGGLEMHAMALAVALAITEMGRQAELTAQAQGVQPHAMLTVARMAACCHEPLQAYEMLTQGSGLAELDAYAVQLTATWQPRDIGAFNDFIAQQRVRNASLQARPEDGSTLGKSRRQGRGKKARR